MSGMQALFMGYGPQLLIVDSADFDGTNDYMTRGAGLDGAADSKTGIMSVWCRVDGGDGAVRDILTAATTVAGGAIRFEIGIDTANKFFVVGRNSAATAILSLTSSAHLAGATWFHVLMSWNLATAGARSVYVNDTDETSQVTFTDDTIDYTWADWGIGAGPDASAKFNGCMAEFYFAPGQYLDFSIVANRRKFISGSGKPVYLGADGSAPTGTAPIAYQRVADGAAVATFATNLGTGGDFAITGTLTAGSTNPSD